MTMNSPTLGISPNGLRTLIAWGLSIETTESIADVVVSGSAVIENCTYFTAGINKSASNLDALHAVLDDRARPYYERRMAA